MAREGEKSLAWLVRDSHIFRKYPRKKIMLTTICSFAKDGKEGAKGYVYNETLARHAGCGHEQIRLYRRQLENDGLVTFERVYGKGRASSFTVHTTALLTAIDASYSPQELEYKRQQAAKSGSVNPKQLVGVKDPQNPKQLSGVKYGLTPNTDPQNPKQLVGAIVDRNINKGEGEAFGADLSALARMWENRLIEHKGVKWISSWLDPQMFAESEGGLCLIALTAFGKARVENELSQMHGSSELRVITRPKDERAP